MKSFGIAALSILALTACGLDGEPIAPEPASEELQAATQAAQNETHVTTHVGVGVGSGGAGGYGGVRVQRGNFSIGVGGGRGSW